MSELDTRIDEIIRTLVRDVAAGVHSMYRGDIRQQTTQLRLSTYAKQASDRIRAAVGGAGMPTPAAGVAAVPAAPGPAGLTAAPALTPEEVTALTRCIMAWMPVGGAPNMATPDMKCTSGAREMCPSWGEREAARLAVRRIAT